MNIKAFFTLPLAFLMMLISLLLPAKPRVDDSIAEVYIYWKIEPLRAICEYKVDLVRKNFWAYEYYGNLHPIDNPIKERSEKALFEGFKFAGRLSDDKITAFLAAVEENGFTAWEGNYPPPFIDLGSGPWRITVVFADGTTQVSSGNSANGQPEHWAEMRAAFNALTGKDILA